MRGKGRSARHSRGSQQKDARLKSSRGRDVTSPYSHFVPLRMGSFWRSGDLANRRFREKSPHIYPHYADMLNRKQLRQRSPPTRPKLFIKDVWAHVQITSFLRVFFSSSPGTGLNFDPSKTLLSSLDLDQEKKQKRQIPVCVSKVLKPDADYIQNVEIITLLRPQCARNGDGTTARLSGPG